MGFIRTHWGKIAVIGSVITFLIDTYLTKKSNDIADKANSIIINAEIIDPMRGGINDHWVNSLEPQQTVVFKQSIDDAGMIQFNKDFYIKLVNAGSAVATLNISHLSEMYRGERGNGKKIDKETYEKYKKELGEKDVSENDFIGFANINLDKNRIEIVNNKENHTYGALRLERGNPIFLKVKIPYLILKSDFMNSSLKLNKPIAYEFAQQKLGFYFGQQPNKNFVSPRYVLNYPEENKEYEQKFCLYFKLEENLDRNVNKFTDIGLPIELGRSNTIKVDLKTINEVDSTNLCNRNL